MTDPFESVLAESLHTRAAQVGPHQHGFGEVRRRVRRHRQRQLAAGLLPAAAGFGWFVTRPVADDPLRPGGDAALDCGSTLPASTQPGLENESTSTTILLDPNNNPVGVSTTYPLATVPEATTYPSSTLPPTTIAYVMDSNGNMVMVTAVYDPQRDGTTTTTYPELFASSTAPGTDAVATTIACEDPTSMPPSTGPGLGDTTTSSSVPGAGDGYGGYQAYTVVEGDSLISITSRFGITMTALADANGWPNGGADHRLFPGDVIRIPPGNTSPNDSTTTTSIG